MKKQAILLIIGCMLYLTSCEIDFLDTISLSNHAKSDYYTTLNQYERALAGCYSYNQRRTTARNENYAIGIPVLGQAGTDETFIVRDKGVLWESHVQLDDYTSLSSDNLVCEQVWINHYSGINATNEIIDRIQSLDNDVIQNNPRYREISGEAKFLQALWYFNLVRIFGGVPVVTSTVVSTEDMSVLGRDSIQKVYSRIFNLLEEAITVLPEKPANNQFGRATKYAAHALLSKVALHVASSMHLMNLSEDIKLNGINSYDWLLKAGDNFLSKDETIHHYYSLAKDQADTVLSYFAPEYLMSKFTDVFYPNESSKEILFEIIMSSDFAQETGSYFGSLFGPAGTSAAGGGQRVIWPVNPILLDNFTFTFSGSGANTVYSSVDSRFLWTMATYTVNANGTITPLSGSGIYRSCQIGKFRVDMPPTYNQFRTPVNNPVLRVSEICLIYAEAQAELDNLNGLGITAEALKYLNIVRKRAVVPEYTSESVKNTVLLSEKTIQGNKEMKGYATTTDIEHFRRAILNERMLELTGEGHRWFDLVRMGVLENVVIQTSQFANGITPDRCPIRIVKPYHVFRPIPGREISLHKGALLQNFGYN